MENFLNIIKNLKDLLPKSHTRFAGGMIYGGLALIAGPPVIQQIIFSFAEKQLDLHLTDNDAIYGFGLVLWGSIYHLIMSRLQELTDVIKNRERREIRAKLLIDARAYLEENEFNKTIFCETDIYARIKPYLSEKLKQNIESSANDLIIKIGGGRGSGCNNFKSTILDELTLLEQKWDLI